MSKDELYEVTFHIFNAEASGESAPDNIDVVSTTGRSVFEAFDNLSRGRAKTVSSHKT